SRMWAVSSFFFTSRRRHTRFSRDWSSDVCSSDLGEGGLDIHRLIAQTIQTELVPRLIGKDPAQIEHIWADLWSITHFLGRDRRRSEERRVGKECGCRLGAGD